ncbi:MAG: hypothetical protein K0R48_205 [Gammaproteobacteria bacterium]|jgi:PAS domain S-box-containing protein|nr:hypothetical protein [Gammaproteobacteria bacterium]
MQQVIRQNLDKEDVYQLLDMIDLAVYWKDCEGHYLGCNRHYLEILSLTDRSQVIGKTDYDFYSKEDADQMRENNALAIQQATFVGEESATINGQLEYYLSTKTRLLDITGAVVGVFGSSIRITDIKNKMEQEKQLAIREEELKTAQIVDLVPAFIYWKHKDGPYIACNQYQKDIWGFDIAGKTEYDIFSREEADKFKLVDQYVLEHGSYSGEEIVTNPVDETTKYVFSSKRQLRDSKGNVIGIVGVSMDITDRKNAERLALENQAHKIVQEQQQKFKKIVEQVVHDIRSPIASIQMILPLCNNKLPENLRVPLNRSASRILDIANNLLNQFKLVKKDAVATDEAFPVSTLISAELLEIITEKKYEHSRLSIDFITRISPSGYFAFLNVDVQTFKRMMSNLINNAVEAFDGKIGEIITSLEVIANTVQIIIQDNGKGMPEEVKANILNNTAVTSGKSDGHGIGFEQIRTTLAKNNGTLNIETAIGIGTKIILTFPKIAAPNWIAEKIEVCEDDLIIILDDDESIHGAWDARFNQVAPEIERKNFKDGRVAISFMNHLSSEEKDKIFLLTDYELLSQNLHGLDVVKQTGVKRSILVTSHHNNQRIRDLAQVTETKILPKPLASEVEIIIKTSETNAVKKLRTVDLVVVDDYKSLVDTFIFNYSVNRNYKVCGYYTAKEFLDNVHLYAKDTKFLIDNQFKTENITGIEIAHLLHQDGYTRLYLFSGTDYTNDPTIPDYLTPIFKTDLAFIEELLNEK